MKGSHPPTLLTLVRRSLRGECSSLAGTTVLVATSGGPDSQALLHALAWHREAFRMTLVAHGIHHGLRAEADAELDGAESLARSLGVPFARSRVQVDEGGNLQARARNARFEALRLAASASGARFIATAHHANDRAETLLLRLLRGAGPRGLAVLPPVVDGLARPMLRATREAIDAHVERHSLSFSKDPSNSDPRFARVRVRNEVIPLLRELDPQVIRHLTDLADRLSFEPDARAPKPEESEGDGK
jgi:tRNA(Ile)-lysidine synthase